MDNPEPIALQDYLWRREQAWLLIEKKARPFLAKSFADRKQAVMTNDSLTGEEYDHLVFHFTNQIMTAVRAAFDAECAECKEGTGNLDISRMVEQMQQIWLLLQRPS